jgi:hypothetical protein
MSEPSSPTPSNHQEGAAELRVADVMDSDVVPALVTVEELQDVPSHSQGTSSAKLEPEAPERRTLYRPKPKRTLLVRKAMAQAKARTEMTSVPMGRRPTAPAPVFTPRPRPPVRSVIPGPVVRCTSTVITPCDLVALVEDFPSVSAVEIYETAIHHMALGPRKQGDIKNTLEAITICRTQLGENITRLVHERKTLSGLRRGLKRLVAELTHPTSPQHN